MRRAIVLFFVLAASVSAQLPRPFYSWWNSPVAKDLNLSQGQRKQIRMIVQGYRSPLIELRARIDQSEHDLEYQFNQEPVDTQKANQAIERLSAARADLTRTLSQMSLRLRALLSQQQWQELQRRRPVKPQAAPTESDAQH